ncbi:MAG: SDR family oxidoreductase [Thermoanaerobaculia bacterium]|nr:SDR family oxidoreductase [Thermoanaerobaculia bacterium]
MPSFRDQIALVTGGAGGIGRALGRELAVSGARVVLTDVRIEELEAAAEDLSASGAGVDTLQLDVSDAAAFRRVVEDIVARYGRLDLLFNNAGIGITGEVRDMDQDAWDRIIDVNLKGVVHGIQAAYPQMISQGSGHIANVACVAGLVPFPLTAAYCATKHAVVGLSTSLRAEARDLGVGVSVVCPGTVATEMYDAIEYIQVDKDAVMAAIRRGMVPASRCARQILRGVARNRAMIPVNAHTRLVWWLYRFSPRLFFVLSGLGFRRVRSVLRTSTERSDSEGP